MLPPMWQLANILSYLNNDCWLGCINGSFYLPSLGTKVQRHHITLLGKPIIQDFQDTASIGGENAWEIIIKRVSKVATRFRRLGKNFTWYAVETADSVHALQTNDNFVEDRHGSTHKTSIAALGHNCNSNRASPLLIQFSRRLRRRPLTFDRCSSEGYPKLAG